MPRSWQGNLTQGAAIQRSRSTAIFLLVLTFLIGAPQVRGGPPAYTLATPLRTGYRPEISVRVNGAGPFWCTFDSGAGAGFLLRRQIGEAIGLRSTRTERSFGEGPASVMSDIVPGTDLQVDKLRIPRQSIRLRALSED